ncbi:hypothetical protein ACHAXT_006401 [Thalassiosira profunda]
MKTSLAFLAAALSLGSSAAFVAPGTGAARPASALAAKSDGGDGGKTLAASALAAAYILGGLASADAAFAMEDTNMPAFADSSSVVLAARSGGRAGGRAAPRRAAPAASRTKVINQRTTVIAPPPVVMGGGYGYGMYGGGFGYDPTLSLGLSAVSAIGNGMREGRQNSMIAEERAELQASKEREADMAARIRQLEMMQMQQQGAMQGQGAPVIYAQPPAQPAQ